MLVEVILSVNQRNIFIFAPERYDKIIQCQSFLEIMNLLHRLAFLPYALLSRNTN